MPKPLNLLIIQQAPDWGGAEAWMANLVDFFSQKKVSVTAYTNLPKLKKSFKQSGAKVYHLPFILDIIGNLKGLIKTLLLLPYAVCFYLQVLQKAKKSNTNLILLSGFSEKLVITWLSGIFKLPVVWFEYGPLEPVFKKLFYLPKICYLFTKHLPKKVLTISQHTRFDLISSARISPAKLKLIYPGVKITRQINKLKSPIIGSLSRVAPEKGQSQLIKAWPKVIIQIPQARLLIAGQGPDQPYLQQLVKRLKLNGSVKLLGFIDNKRQFYQSLSIFIFLSIWHLEGFGLVLAEAMAHGVPVIAYDHGPTKEIISPQEGILVKTSDVDALAQAIIRLLQSPKTRSQLSKNASQKAARQFNLEIQADKILKELYETV